jgi:hypothetical protein
MENAANTESAAPDRVAPEVAAPAKAGPVWRFLIQPRWLLWHVFMVVSFWGMLWLGDWQLHRALSGNALSWAYTFEWPLFSGFAVVFWAKTIRDEFRIRRGQAVPGSAVSGFGVDSNLPLSARSVMATQAAEGPQEPEDEALSSYNAYLARLNAKVSRNQGHEWRS